VTGALEKPGGGFRIDHPLDPENKHLSHSFVESPDMKNIYDGVVQLDEEGTAWVELPEWFKELNGSFRYHLTAIGSPAPDLHVAEEVSDNRFRIAGGAKGTKVCWQVTGIRKDSWAEANRIVVEEDKDEQERVLLQWAEVAATTPLQVARSDVAVAMPATSPPSAEPAIPPLPRMPDVAAAMPATTPPSAEPIMAPIAAPARAPSPPME
jgi:hypothetical protein